LSGEEADAVATLLRARWRFAKIKSGVMMGGFLDRLASGGGSLFMLLGRVALAAIFVPSGFGKLAHIDVFAHTLAARGVPMSGLMAVIGACVEFFGSLAVVLGFKTRYAALLMAAFTAFAAVIAHRFWQLEGPAHEAQYLQFMKNMAILGGYICLFAAGPGAIAIDRRGR
jgi:putative oxidoreductase